MRCTEGIHSPPKIRQDPRTVTSIYVEAHMCTYGSLSKSWQQKHLHPTKKINWTPCIFSSTEIDAHICTYALENLAQARTMPVPECVIYGHLSPYIFIHVCKHPTIYSPGSPCTELSYHTFPYISIYMFNYIFQHHLAVATLYSITSSKIQLGTVWCL